MADSIQERTNSLDEITDCGIVSPLDGSPDVARQFYQGANP